jgi:hypothetical protein
MADVVEKNLAALGQLTVDFIVSGVVGKHAVLFAPAGMARPAISRYL